MVANNPARKRAAIAAAAIVGSVLVVCVYFAWRSPPQMGPDEETFRGVDALLTALTARDERLLDQCARRLSLLSEAGKIPRDAASYLDGIIAKARSGAWQASAEKLYAFMMAQRREGATGQPHQKQHPGQRVAQRK